MPAVARDSLKNSMGYRRRKVALERVAVTRENNYPDLGFMGFGRIFYGIDSLGISIGDLVNSV